MKDNNTPQTFIRLAEPGDTEAIYRYRCDEEVMFWAAGGYADGTQTKAQIEETIRNQRTRDTSLLYVIEVEEASLSHGGASTRRVVGTISFRDLDRIARHATVGMLIGDKAYWGRGIGLQVVRQFVRMLFTRFNVNRINIDTFADNVRAIRCYEKAGFVREGLRRQQMWTMNGFRDQVLMGLLREDWLQSEDGRQVFYLEGQA